MAVLKIYNDIQTEEQKKESRFCGDVEGVALKILMRFVKA